jgi:hypothetical protein
MLPYEPLPNEIPGTAYGRPADYEAPPVPLENGEMMPSRVPALHPATRASVTVQPPLPRPRPPELAARKPIDDAKPDAKPAIAANPSAKSEPKADVTGSAAVAAPSASPIAGAPPATAAARPAKSLAPPPIND